MILDFITIPNFFQDPESIYKLAMDQEYYTWETHPYDKQSNIFFNGVKTLPLKKTMKQEDYNSLGNECLSKIVRTTIKPGMEVQLNADYTCFFASIFDNDISDPKLCHTDTTLLSGFVYLQKQKPKFPFLHGTSIIVNGKPVQVEYEYNTCVLFRSDYVHIPNHGFGDSLENSRLTFNLFINSFDISIKNKLFKLK